MKKTIVVLIMLAVVLSLTCAKEKKSKAKNVIENVSEEVTDFIDSIEDEAVSRSQIDSMFSLANQLNEDIKTAISNTDPHMAEELAYVIEDEKKQLDKLIPHLKKSAEWTLKDEEKLKAVSAEYKKISRKYKPKK